MNQDGKIRQVGAERAAERRIPRAKQARIAWLALLLGLAAGFAFTFAEMWIRWFPHWRNARDGLWERLTEGESYYTHGPLMPLISLLIFLLLVRHTRVPVQPRPRLGLLVLSVGLVGHLAGCFMRVNFVSGFSLIIVLIGLVLALWGAQALRRFWFAVALLAFMVPLPEVSIAQLNFRLKMFASEWGVGLANAFGIVAVCKGNQVFLEGDKSMVVANVCNGLRTLISVIAFGALYAYVCRLKGAWRIFLFAMSVPAALLGNSVRILALIVVAHVWDVPTATGKFHDISGVLIFFLAFLMLFGVEKLILWARQFLGRPAEILPLFHDVRRTEQDAGQWERLVGAASGRGCWAAIVLVWLTAGGAYWLNSAKPPVWNQAMAQGCLPEAIHSQGQALVGYDMPLDERTLTILETGDYVYRRYVCAAAPAIDACVIFSRDNRKGTHPPDVCLEGGSQDITEKRDVQARLGGQGAVPCRGLLVQSNRVKSYFLYTYKCGRKYTSSFWGQQFWILVNGLLARNASGALIRVSTPVVGEDDADARRRALAAMEEVLPHIDRTLP